MADVPEDTGQSVDTLIVNLRELLGLAEDAAPEEVLAAAVELLRSMQASEAEAARALGLKEDADRTTIVAAIGKLKADMVPKDGVEKLMAGNDALRGEVRALKARSVAAETDQVIAKHSAEGKLTAAQAKFWREKLTGDVDQFEDRRQEFEELMAMSQAIVEPGKTVPPGSTAPAGREAVIAKAQAEYLAEGQQIELMPEYVNAVLREQKRRPLNDEEHKKLAAE